MPHGAPAGAHGLDHAWMSGFAKCDIVVAFCGREIAKLSSLYDGLVFQITKLLNCRRCWTSVFAKTGRSSFGMFAFGLNFHKNPRVLCAPTKSLMFLHMYLRRC